MTINKLLGLPNNDIKMIANIQTTNYEGKSAIKNIQ